MEFDGKSYCGDCGARDDVDWLGKHYAKFEGKRSGLAWLLLVLGAITFAGALAGAIGAENWKERGFFIAMFVLGSVVISVMSGKAWSRFAMVASVPLAGALFVSSTGEPWGALLTLPALILTTSTFTDVRTQLYFRLPVERVALRKHFDRAGSNPLAVRASQLALLGLFIPGVGLISLVMGVMALTRVNSKAIPPVGNVSVAVGAIVFSLFTSFIWASALLGVGASV